MARVAVLKARNGTYTAKDGSEKTAYITVGNVFENERGRSYKLDAVPVNFDGWLFESEPPAKQAAKGPDDEIPF